MRIAFALTLVLCACPEGAFDADAPQDAILPVVVDDHLVAADRVDPALVTLRLDEGEVVGEQRIAVAGPPTRLVPVDGTTAVLALSPTTETVDLVDLAADVRVTFPLGAPFEALSVSPDGDSAIAYFPPGTATTVFHNTNELAWIDLDPAATPDNAVRRRTLASLGGAPRTIALSPEVGGRRFAFVLSDEHVAIVDLDDPDARERSVPLVSLNTGGTRTPSGVRFAVDSSDEAGDRLWAIVTTVEGASVFALEVTDAAPEAPGEPAFDVRLTQLAGFSSGGQVALLRRPDGVLVALILSPAAGQATVTQLSNGLSEHLALSAGVDQVNTYHDGDRPIAVIFRRGATAFHILDVAALAEKKDKAFRTRFAHRPLLDLMALPGTPLFVAFHDDADEAVSVINADTDRVTTFGRTGSVRGVHLATELGQLFLLTALGGDRYVVSVDLETLHPESVAVDGPADALHVLPAANTLAVSADTPGGHLTLWPAVGPSPDNALTLPGYLLGGFLDRTRAGR